jgi:hypothetical protein
MTRYSYLFSQIVRAYKSVRPKSVHRAICCFRTKVSSECAIKLHLTSYHAQIEQTWPYSSPLLHHARYTHGKDNSCNINTLENLAVGARSAVPRPRLDTSESQTYMYISFIPTSVAGAGRQPRYYAGSARWPLQVPHAMPSETSNALHTGNRVNAWRV